MFDVIDKTVDSHRTVESTKVMMMNIMTAPTVDRALEVQAVEIIARSIKPLFAQPFEYISVSANTQGEVHLNGLVHDRLLAENAVQLVREIPGVRFAFNDISTLCVGCAIEL